MTTLGPFTDLRPLGGGAMSEVFTARDSRSGRTVALKIARPGTEARLMHEAALLQRVRHPGVVEVYETGVSEGRRWLSMERLSGVPLHRWSTAEDRDAAAIADVFAQLTAAVAAVHRAGVVHRDIKPDNVLVGDDGRVCLLDFGLALDARSPTRDCTPAGTPLYMAPELLEGAEATPASDQYALATTLYELLSGRLPFVATTIEALSVRIAAGVPLRPLADCPRGLRADVVRGLHGDPARRFGSVVAFGTAVQRHATRAAPHRRWVSKVRSNLAALFSPRLTPAYG